MGKVIPKETIAQIPVLYKELKSYAKVAEKLGIAASTVKKYLQLSQTGAVAPPPHARMTPELAAQVNEVYPQILNMAAVGRMFNLSAAQVKRCLTPENAKLQTLQYDDRDVLWYYIYRLFGENTEEYPVSKWNLTQMEKFKRDGISYRAQYLTLKYFYEVEHNSIQNARGSIGIIPHVASRAEEYYRRKAKRADEITAMIQEQLAQDRIEIPIKPSYATKKSKKKIDLNTLVTDDD